MEKNVCAVFYDDAGQVQEVRRCPASVLALASDPHLLVTASDAQDVSLNLSGFAVIDGELVNTSEHPAFVVRGLRQLDGLALGLLSNVSGAGGGFAGLYQAKCLEAQAIVAGGDFVAPLLTAEADRAGVSVSDLAARVLDRVASQRSREAKIEAERQYCQGLVRLAQSAEAVALILVEFRDLAAGVNTRVA